MTEASYQPVLIGFVSLSLKAPFQCHQSVVFEHFFTVGLSFGGQFVLVESVDFDARLKDKSRARYKLDLYG